MKIFMYLFIYENIHVICLAKLFVCCKMQKNLLIICHCLLVGEVMSLYQEGIKRAVRIACKGGAVQKREDEL